MADSLRNSGIDIVGKISWGSHMAQLFSSKADYFKISIPYVVSGLNNNELCLWIYSDITTYTEVVSEIKEYFEDVEEYINRGQLILISYERWYVKNGTFSPIRAKNKWRKIVNYSVEQGYDGFRAVADASWLEKRFYKEFFNYERNANKIIDELPFIVLCLYDERKLNAVAVSKIISNHLYVILEDCGNTELITNTELMVKTKQLVTVEERYKKLIELLPDSIFIHSKDRIYYCNNSAVEIIGTKNVGELYEKSILDILDSDCKGKYIKRLNRILYGSQENIYYQTNIRCFNGRVKTAQIITTKYYYRGISVLLSVVRDITPFKRITELERDIERGRTELTRTLENDRLKTEFFINMSHELKTPLSVILAALDILDVSTGSDSKEDTNKKYLKIIRQNSYRLSRLVNNIIDISKIESNYYKIKRDNCEIVSLLESTIQFVAEYAKQKNIAIIFDTNTEEKIMAIDSEQIVRIILNLLSNSIKFTPEGGRIQVHFTDLGEEAEISIKDNGIGIPKEKIIGIFNRFEQVDKSLTRRCEGSGIGLSLVKALVEKHGGNIAVKSKWGEGSEFIVRIPCKILNDRRECSKKLTAEECVAKINVEFSDIYL